MAVLQAARINLVAIANNHVLDYENDGLLEMLSVLERARIAHAGVSQDRANAWRPAVFTSGKNRVAMIAFTDNEPEWRRPMKSQAPAMFR